MAVVAQVSTLLLDDSVTHGATTQRQWVATATTLDNNAGAGVVITIVQTSGASAPLQADQLKLICISDNSGLGSTIINFTLNPALASQTATFFFTADGTNVGAIRAGTVRMTLQAINTTGTASQNYNVDTDLTNNTPPTGFHVHTANQGWIRGNTTSTSVLSNIALGGAKTSPASYIDSLFVRTTLGSDTYLARVLNITISNTAPALSGNTNSASTGNFDVSFAGVVDNRFPVSLGTTATSVVQPIATLTGLADYLLTATNDSMNVDPRLTVSVQAQNTSTRANGANKTSYIISADQLFIWAKTVNARAELTANITMTQRIKNGATVLFTDTTKITAALDAWTPNPGIDATSIVVAPAGNRTQEAFPNAPANAVGLGTGTQIIGFASAYTANRSTAIQCNTMMDVGVNENIRFEYIDTTGVALILDSTPFIRIFKINVDGTQTDNIAAVLMTSIGNNSYQYTWQTPNQEGPFVIEVRAVKDGGNVSGNTKVSVKPQSKKLSF